MAVAVAVAGTGTLAGTEVNVAGTVAGAGSGTLVGTVAVEGTVDGAGTGTGTGSVSVEERETETCSWQGVLGCDMLGLAAAVAVKR